jgi:hypothetical protein
MGDKELKLVKILNTINAFNESVAKNFHKFEYAIFTLKYCIGRDTLHSFDGSRCYNCSNFEMPSIDISTSDFIDFKKHFGAGFASKLIEIIDKWPKDNNFPYLYNDIINSLPEYKTMLELHSDWMHMSEEQKFTEILDLCSFQKQYFNKKQELRDIEKNFK